MSVDHTACVAPRIALLMPICASKTGCAIIPTAITTGGRVVRIRRGHLKHVPCYVGLVVCHQSAIYLFCIISLTYVLSVRSKGLQKGFLAVNPNDPSMGDYSMGSALLTICDDESICCGYQNFTDCCNKNLGTRINADGQPISGSSSSISYSTTTNANGQPTSSSSSSISHGTITSSPGSTSPQNPLTSQSSSEGLSTGAKVGIGIGIPAALLLGAVAGFFILQRRRGDRSSGLGGRGSEGVIPSGSEHYPQVTGTSEVSGDHIFLNSSAAYPQGLGINRFPIGGVQAQGQGHPRLVQSYSVHPRNELLGDCARPGELE